MPISKKNIILAGNQNVGKSSLFNALTGLNQKVANFPGVTTEKKNGSYTYDEVHYNVIDLPGTYSLYPASLDENVVFSLIQEQVAHNDALIIYVADAINLERNLLFFTQLLDLNLNCMLVISKMDLAAKKGIQININKLSELFNNIDVFPIINYHSDTIAEIKAKIAHPTPYKKTPFTSVNEYMGDELANHFTQSFKKESYVQLCLAIKEKKVAINDHNGVSQNTNIQEFWVEEKNKIPKKELSLRYKKIKQLLSFCIKFTGKPNGTSHTLKWDKILTHPLWGFIGLVLIMALIFQSIFTWSSIPMNFIDATFVQLAGYIKAIAPDNFFILLISEGIIPGVGGVLIFVPQIIILFGFLALLEEIGYMARVVFIMDKFLQKFGLNGRSIVPLVSGIACAVPAIQSTKNIENWKERLITILVIPFMSCSARLPIYTTMIALVIPKDNVFFGVINLQGLVLWLLYLFGVLCSFGISWVLNFTITKAEKGFLIMELPSYHTPSLKSVLYQIYNKTKPFVVEVGKVIVVFSIIIWLLASQGFNSERQEAIQSLHQARDWNNANPLQQNAMEASVNLETSYLGWLGKKIEPLIRPLGYDWKIGVGILSSFVAREVFVGTLSTIYSVGIADEKPLLDKLREERFPNGSPVYSLATGLSLLIFYALAMQCVSTLAIIKKETNTWKWPTLQFVSMSFLAYLSALITYNLTIFLS